MIKQRLMPGEGAVGHADSRTWVSNSNATGQTTSARRGADADLAAAHGWFRGAARTRIWRLHMAGSAVACDANRIGGTQILAVKPDDEARTDLIAPSMWPYPSEQTGPAGGTPPLATRPLECACQRRPEQPTLPLCAASGHALSLRRGGGTRRRTVFPG